MTVRPSSNERGMSVVETLIAAAISAVVFGVFAGVLIAVQQVVVREEERVHGNDQTRLAIENIDRHVRSADMIYTIDEYTLLVSTRSNTPGATGVQRRCMQWTLTTDGELWWRSWEEGDPATASGWMIVATDIVNREVSPTVDAFVLDRLVANGGLTVDVSLLVNSNLQNQPDATIGLETSVTGRNVRQIPGSPPADPPPPCEVLPT